MNLSLSDLKIIDKIIIFLTTLRTTVKHPKLEILLEKLSGLANIEYTKPVDAQEPDKKQIEYEKIKQDISGSTSEPSTLYSGSYNATWGEIINLIS